MSLISNLKSLLTPRDIFARPYFSGESISPTERFDFEAHVGDPLHNGVVAACVNAIARALPDAPLLLEKRTEAGWQSVEEHACLEVLRSPNLDHSDADVWGLTSGYKATRGQAFWLLLPNKDGEVGEIHVWNTDRVTVLGDENQFISGYRVRRENGSHFDADRSQIIHFRHLPDFHNPRIGWSPLRTGRSQIAGDNVATSYHSSILFNAGVVSLLISLKDSAAGGQVTPQQFQQVLDNIRRASRERSGGVEGINLPLEVHKLAYSPDEMSLHKLIEYYETRICSVMGVSQRVAGLGSDPTYNNLGEALNDFWERRIVPDRNADAATLNRQWLPLFGLDDGNWRFRFDFSNVPALQENRDALHNRVRADFEKGLLDKQQARALLGYGTSSNGPFAGVFYGEKAGTQTEAKSEYEYSFKADPNWDESRHPRDRRGRFSNGTSSNGTFAYSDEGTGTTSSDGSQDDGIDNVTPVGSASATLAETHLLELLDGDQQFADKPLSAQRRANYARSLRYVTSQIPTHLQKHIIQKVKFTYGFNSPDDLSEYYNKTYFQAGEGKEKWKYVSGSWLEAKGMLFLDGGLNFRGWNVHHQRNCVYGHELGHVVDSYPGFRISGSPEWLEAYEKEIKGHPTALSIYADEGGASEAFAEFASLMFATQSFLKREGAFELQRQDAATIYCQLKGLNRCYEVWKKHLNNSN